MELISIDEDWSSVEERRLNGERIEMGMKNYVLCLIAATTENNHEAMKKLLIIQKNSWASEFTTIVRNRKVC
jgi:hypothetical protein